MAGGFGSKGVSAWGLGAYEVAAKIAKWLKLGTVAVITLVGALVTLARDGAPTFSMRACVPHAGRCTAREALGFLAQKDQRPRGLLLGPLFT